MLRRDGPARPPAVPPSRVVARTGPAPAQRSLLELQRAAGNAAAGAAVAAGSGGVADAIGHSYVFIVGPEDDKDLAAARQHYARPETLRVVPTKEGGFSLADVIAHIASLTHFVREIVIVAHGTPGGLLQMKATPTDQDDITTVAEIEQQVRSGAAQPPPGVITEATRIRLQACNTGKSFELVQLLDRAIGGGKGTVYAPKYQAAFGPRAVFSHEGVTGLEISSPVPLAPAELAERLEERYGDAIGFDVRSHATEHREMTEAEHWRRVAESAKVWKEGEGFMHLTTEVLFGANLDDASLYTRSDRYDPTEI